MSNTPQEKLIVYGHHYCSHAEWLANELNKHDVAYEWRDVRRGEPHFQDELRQLADGNLSVPTVIFEDGTVMVEPWPNTVLEKLGVKKPGLLKRIFGGE